ncbi:MAG: hypothetical protein A2X18_01175 [Bacteroidetes bacterium GWF2_40_14]|nr:MAG: hypothetical protein A2X18_01175 [Bacteroidetes bacterium GWF2_40_14]
MTIDFVRFPLIICVFFAHSGMHATFHEYDFQGPTGFHFFENISYLITFIIAKIPTRAFFFISGFLFFYNVIKWDSEKYKTKIKNRFCTLLIPYLFWNAFVTLILVVVHYLQLFPDLIAWDNPDFFSFKNISGMFWNLNGGGYPRLFPFWYIRDLMVVVVFSPLIWLMVRYLRLPGILIAAFIWVSDILGFNIAGIVGISTVSFFFFMSGAYFSINKINIISFSNKFFYSSIVLYPLFVFADLMSRDMSFNIYIHNIGIIVGIIFMFNIVSAGINSGKLRNSLILASSSFFIFAAHEPFLTFTRKVIIYFIKPDTELLCFITYFVPAILTLGVMLSLFLFMRKFMPGLLCVITGGRLFRRVGKEKNEK